MDADDRKRAPMMNWDGLLASIFFGVGPEWRSFNAACERWWLAEKVAFLPDKHGKPTRFTFRFLGGKWWPSGALL